MRLTVPGAPASGMHATYRGRPGTNVAVLTFSHFAPPPTGRVYCAWAKRDGRWTSIGSVTIETDGSALVIVEGPQVAVPPDALQVTMEPGGAGDTPTSDPVVIWTKP
jgi:hypothetical protein